MKQSKVVKVESVFEAEDITHLSELLIRLRRDIPEGISDSEVILDIEANNQGGVDIGIKYSRWETDLEQEKRLRDQKAAELAHQRNIEKQKEAFKAQAETDKRDREMLYEALKKEFEPKPPAPLFDAAEAGLSAPIQPKP